MLPISSQVILSFLSFLIVAFGQPAWSWWSGLIAAVIGYALFLRVLLCYETPKKRFLLAFVWFAAVQWIQLSWLISHPYLYMYILHVLFALALGVQFGILGIFITVSSLQRYIYMLGLAGFWTLCEWSRLFFLAGYSWNPIGLSLTGSIYAMQLASLWGIFGLSFIVMLTNLLLVRAWIQRFALIPCVMSIIVASIPYLYGFIHLQIHQEIMANRENSKFNALLVQTAFPPEEINSLGDSRKLVSHIFEEWQAILETMKPQLGQPVDLIVLPEYVVPGGTYSFLFPYKSVQNAFSEILGADILPFLPAPEEPLAREIDTIMGPVKFVSNAFWVQGLANIFKAGIVAGLEDAEDVSSSKREFYSAAMYFRPWDSSSQEPFLAERYEKRVLVPMGEYIPFEWCRALAAQYGVSGSFTAGKEAKVFTANSHPFGLSICYEETFGHVMRENRQQGASLLVNLTSDVWYPDSRLPMQHFTHARLRTVENGIPLIRASNMGITGAIDSLGRVVAVVQKDGQPSEWPFEALLVNVPTYHYQTLYTKYGDTLIVVIALLCVLCAGIFRKLEKNLVPHTNE